MPKTGLSVKDLTVKQNSVKNAKDLLSTLE